MTPVRCLGLPIGFCNHSRCTVLESVGDYHPQRVTCLSSYCKYAADHVPVVGQSKKHPSRLHAHINGIFPPLRGFRSFSDCDRGISARGDVNCLDAMCDSIFGDGDVIDIEFSEEVTMCMSSRVCANLTDNSSKCIRPFDTSVSQEVLDISFKWSDNLGSIYYGL